MLNIYIFKMKSDVLIQFMSSQSYLFNSLKAYLIFTAQ